MFTGIVDHTGCITQIIPTVSGLRFTIATEFKDLKEGESISVDGACLTVIAAKQNSFDCDLSPETLNLTTAKSYKLDTTVNLERALLASDRMGGHYVTGHVDQKATLVKKLQHGEFTEMCFESISPSASNLLVKKGSITVNGVSLTINDVGTDLKNPSFSVMLIPHTLFLTNLKNLNVGDSVNLEFDWMTKIILKEVACRMNLLQ